jgi:hypothetical protein
VKKEKETFGFQIPPISVLVTTALRLIYSLVVNEYMGSVKVKLDGSYIHRFLAQTNKYNITFVDPETNECNLNIFVGTDEWMTFYCSDISLNMQNYKS